MSPRNKFLLVIHLPMPCDDYCTSITDEEEELNNRSFNSSSNYSLMAFSCTTAKREYRSLVFASSSDNKCCEALYLPHPSPVHWLICFVAVAFNLYLRPRDSLHTSVIAWTKEEGSGRVVIEPVVMERIINIVVSCPLGTISVLESKRIKCVDHRFNINLGDYAAFSVSISIDK